MRCKLCDLESKEQTVVIEGAIRENFVSYEGYILCHNCYDNEDFFVCEDCNNFIADSSHGNDDINLCEVCAEDWSECNECGTFRRFTDGCACDEYNEEEEDESKFLHDASYVPNEFIYSKLPHENTLFLGVELEVEVSRDSSATSLLDGMENLLFISKKENIIYLKKDGSLNNGFEIVTHPMTLQSMHRTFNWKEFLKDISKLGLTSYKKGTAGLHIHLDKDFFTFRELVQLKAFFWNAIKNIERFSMRHGRGTNFCVFEKYDSGVVLNCIRLNKIEQKSRYSAVNAFTDKGTVELRIFRGTLYYSRLLATLQFADAIANYMKVVGMQACLSIKAWDYFVDWAKKTNRYEKMLNYFKMKDLYYQEDYKLSSEASVASEEIAIDTNVLDEAVCSEDTSVLDEAA